MQKHPFSPLILANKSQLIFTPCPGSQGVTLAQSISQLKQAGTTVLLTLMQAEEMAINQVTSLPQLCAAAGITWYHLPIEDGKVPSQQFDRQWQRHKAEVVKKLQQGATVTVHCKGGRGRTGLVIGLLLLELGWPSSNAITAVQQVQEKSLRNELQLNYFHRYAKQLNLAEDNAAATGVFSD